MAIKTYAGEGGGPHSYRQGGRYSRAGGEGLWPYCHCGHAEGLDEAIAAASEIFCGRFDHPERPRPPPPPAPISNPTSPSAPAASAPPPSVPQQPAAGKADGDSVPKTPPPADTASFVPLKDVSIQDITVILSNLSFPALVEPFQINGMSGKAINRLKTYQSIVDIGNGRISEVVAETFFEDFVVEWKSTGLVPKELLQPKVQSPSKGNPQSQAHSETPLPSKKSGVSLEIHTDTAAAIPS